MNDYTGFMGLNNRLSLMIMLKAERGALKKHSHIVRVKIATSFLEKKFNNVMVLHTSSDFISKTSKKIIRIDKTELSLLHT